MVASELSDMLLLLLVIVDEFVVAFGLVVMESGDAVDKTTVGDDGEGVPVFGEVSSDEIVLIEDDELNGSEEEAVEAMVEVTEDAEESDEVAAVLNGAILVSMRLAAVVDDVIEDGMIVVVVADGEMPDERLVDASNSVLVDECAIGEVMVVVVLVVVPFDSDNMVEVLEDASGPGVLESVIGDLVDDVAVVIDTGVSLAVVWFMEVTIVEFLMGMDEGEVSV